ncbi:hypothetical protein ACFY1U_38600, partial [Streptomyces sp. NPDC001351]
MPAGLVALALGGFEIGIGIGLTEFVIARLLPQVGRSLAVSEAAAGWLISGYALTVAVGATALTAATVRLLRRPVLTGLAVLSTLAPRGGCFYLFGQGLWAWSGCLFVPGLVEGAVLEHG